MMACTAAVPAGVSLSAQGMVMAVCWLAARGLSSAVRRRRPNRGGVELVREFPPVEMEMGGAVCSPDFAAAVWLSARAAATRGSEMPLVKTGARDAGLVPLCVSVVVKGMRGALAAPAAA